jgi:hypothetical protein
MTSAGDGGLLMNFTTSLGNKGRSQGISLVISLSENERSK